MSRKPNTERARYAHDSPHEAEIMFAERYIHKAKQEGGQGDEAILLHLLQLKFGAVAEAVRQEIEDADAQTLFTWSERILMAASLEQVIDD